MDFKVFGKLRSGQRLQRIRQSPHYQHGAFHNTEHTTVLRKGASYLNLLRRYLGKPADVKPKQPVAATRTGLHRLDDAKLQVVWFGHSSYLIHFAGKNILVDPVFSGHASPFAFFGRAFPGSDIYKPGDMPLVDLLLITHDHYDHLDYETLVALKPKVKQVCTALGVGAHLEYWGYKAGMITELDWFESRNFDDKISITATPARHFSGRILKRGQTLWASFVLDFFGYRIFIGGDSGYGKHFKQIGERFGPFELAFLECGQYGDDWPMIHMMPEETAKAGLDIRAKRIIPVHWGKFTLSIHSWDEPIRILKTVEKGDMKILYPQIGQPIQI